MADQEGSADGVDLTGLPVALAVRYSDDEPGSPWTWVLYLDARAADRQREALEAIFTGRLGGDAASHFPWAWKASELVAVRPWRSRWTTRGAVSGCGSATTSASASATGMRPGDRDLRDPRPRPHRRGARHRRAAVEDGPLAFRYRGVCGYGTTFGYAG